jgi:hypothetical protein
LIPAAELETAAMTESKRRFVRVKDVVRLSYEVVPDSEMENAQQVVNFQRSQDADRYPFRPRPVPIGKIADAETTPAYRALSEAILKLDQKLDFIIFMIDKLGGINQGVSFSEPVRCDISGSGILFANKESLSVGTHLKVTLLLGSYNITMPIHFLAKVVRLMGHDDAYGPHPCRIGVDFVYIADEDRESIISHVFEVQRAELRARLEAEARGDKESS